MRVETTVELVVACPFQFLSVKTLDITSAYRSGFTPPVPPVTTFTSAYTNTSASISSTYISTEDKERAGAVLHWNADFVNLAAPQDVGLAWKTSGGGSPRPYLPKCSAHIVAVGTQVGRPNPPSLVVSAVSVDLDPSTTYSQVSDALHSAATGELGTTPTSNYGSISIDDVIYTLDSNSAWAAELASDILSATFDIAESVDIEIEPPALLHSKAPSERIWGIDGTISMTREVRKPITVYHNGTAVLKTISGVKVQQTIVEEWMASRDAAIKDAIRASAATNTPLNTTGLFDSPPDAFSWLSADEQESVNRWITERFQAIVGYNNSNSDRKSAVDSAYEDYVSKLPPEDVALPKSEWLEQVFSRADSESEGSGLLDWVKKVGGQVAGFGSGVVEFITENPKLVGVGGALIGAKMAGIPSWLIVAGLGVATIVILK